MRPRHIAGEDVLQVIGCELDQRPPAPGIDDLAPLVTQMQRWPGQLAIQFRPGSLATVQAFAEAERRCCSGIGWQVEEGPPLTLRITTSEAALEALVSMFPGHK